MSSRHANSQEKVTSGSLTMRMPTLQMVTGANVCIKEILVAEGNVWRKVMLVNLGYIEWELIL